MKGTLYVSDLDGTLLNSRAELSEFTLSALKELAGRGVRFSAATARTAATVSKLLCGTGVNTPVILMNGVCVFDIQKNSYVRVCGIEPEALAETVKTVRRHSLAGFFYSVKDNALTTFYENLDSPGAVRFMEERQKKFGKKFTKLGELSDILSFPIVYYSISDKEEKLAPAAEELRRVPGLRVEYYRDIYEKDCFFLEVCSAQASKSSAVDFLREKYGFRRIVGFGDNFNDIPLLNACDEFHAVANAVDELRERADSVIGANTEDGVARWLLENAVTEGE